MAQELSPEQRSDFEAGLARLGLSGQALTHREARASELRPPTPMSAQADTGADAALAAETTPVVFSSDPEASHAAPTLLDVHDIAQLKRMIGIPDEHYTERRYSDRAIDYPAPLPAQAAQLASTARNRCDLQSKLSEEHADDVRRAASAYIQGHSEKVRSYETMINAAMFPAKMAVFMGESLTVDTRVEIKGEVPVVWHYGTITVVEPAGQIVVMTEFTIKAQNFIVTTSA